MLGWFWFQYKTRCFLVQKLIKNEVDLFFLLVGGLEFSKIQADKAVGW